MSNVGVIARRPESIDEHISSKDAAFMRPAHALVLNAPPLRWMFLRSYLRMYRRRIDADIQALNELRASEQFAPSAVDRIRASVYTVSACSSWYALSYSIFRSGFNLAVVFAALGILAGALLPPHTPLDRGAFAAAFSAAVILALYVSAGLTVSRGWKIDFILSLGVGALLAFAYQHMDFANIVIGAAKEPLYAGKAIQELFLGGSAYSLMIAITALAGGAIYVWTTNLKKRQPEEEIIQTLLHLVRYIKRRRARGNSTQVRRHVAHQLDWIADRFAYDFLKAYATNDADSAAWQMQTGLRLAAGIRGVKKSLILPETDVAVRLDRLVSALRNAANGRWAMFPQADCTLSKVAQLDKAAAFLRGMASFAIPIAISVFAVLKLDDPLKSSLATMFASLAAVNLLALLNPGGFDKQIGAAKSLTDVIRGKT